MLPTSTTSPTKEVMYQKVSERKYLTACPHLCYTVGNKWGFFSHWAVTVCKETRGLKMAAKVAEQSGYETFRHGAVLIRGGAVVNVAANSDNHTSFGQRFRQRHLGRATHHAELACILGLDKSITQGGTVYVARINKNGEWKNSKPCSMCHEVMSYVGIKRVVYTVGPNEWGTYKIEDEDEKTIGY